MKIKTPQSNAMHSDQTSMGNGQGEMLKACCTHETEESDAAVAEPISGQDTK